jgi:chemotaxis protein methyltransferase CheR
MGGSALTENELARFSEFVKNRVGLHFSSGRYDDLQRGITAIAAEQGFDDTSSCLAWIMSNTLDRSLVETLAAALTVGETYFFRDPQVFEAIERSILPAVISRRREQERFLRIWSAGCSTGEEAYSLAILLLRTLHDIDDWSITLLATDINANALKKAESGIYSEWSFRSNPQWVKDRYFRKLSDGRYEINTTIKDLVTFSYLNLVEDAYPALLTNTNALDIILCRNVLMYFSKDAAQATIEKVQRSLIPDGRLIVSATETSIVSSQHLVPEICNGITTYRKSDIMQPSPVLATPIVSGAFSIPEVFKPIAVSQLGTDNQSAPVKKPAENLKPISTPAQVQREPPAIPSLPEKDPYITAVALFESGDYFGAEKILVRYTAGYLHDQRAMALMAQVLANRGDLAGARAWCERAIAHDKLNPFYHHLLATIQQEEGAIYAAIGELRRALYADPSYIPAHFTLANLRRRQGMLEESDVHFRNARTLLNSHQPGEIIGGAGGMSAASLERIICSIIGKEGIA